MYQVNNAQLQLPVTFISAGIDDIRKKTVNLDLDLSNNSLKKKLNERLHSLVPLLYHKSI